MTLSEIRENKSEYLAHSQNHKYVERRKGKNGEWWYIYPEDLKKTAKNAANDWREGAKNVGNAIGKAAKNGFNDWKSGVKSIGNSVSRGVSDLTSGRTKKRLGYKLVGKAGELRRANEAEDTRSRASADRMHTTQLQLNKARKDMHFSNKVRNNAYSNMTKNRSDYTSKAAKALDRDRRDNNVGGALAKSPAGQQYRDEAIKSYKKYNGANAVYKDAAQRNDEAVSRYNDAKRHSDAAKASNKKVQSAYNSKKAKRRRKFRNNRAKMLTRVSDILLD